MVLDPTPSDRLKDLTERFERYDGKAFIGDAAWQHIEGEAGPTMAVFIEKYVRRPISEIDKHAHELLDFAISREEQSFVLQFGTGDERVTWRVNRHEDQRLASENGDSQEPE
jgi:hypothetical protein